MEEIDFSISSHFKNLDDPRKYNVRHHLIDIITIAICALICGAQNWVDVELYGKSKYEWLKQFLQLPGNIPSHDTFGRVFSMLDPKQFTDAFISWAKSIQLLIGHIAIDGKTLRASHDKAMEKGAIHMVSAWAVGNGIVLGQIKTDEKSNEITAIPELIRQFELNDTIVSIDAMDAKRLLPNKLSITRRLCLFFERQPFQPT